jgi:hypothetical protein
MAQARRPTLDSMIVAGSLALVGIAGGWAAGAWDAPAEQAATTPTEARHLGSAPESDARAGVPDVCSRRVGCLVR